MKPKLRPLRSIKMNKPLAIVFRKKRRRKLPISAMSEVILPHCTDTATYVKR